MSSASFFVSPHELWSRIGHEKSLAYEKWPDFDEALTQDATREMAVQVNGKLKARIVVDANAAEDAVKTLAQGTLNAGAHTIQWSGISDAGTRLPAGVYMYRLQAGRNVAQRKLILVN